MKFYNINSTYTPPKELESADINLAIYISIKELIAEIKDEDESPFKKILIISDLIKYITNKDLLFPTIGYLRKLGFFKSIDKNFLAWQNKFFQTSLYSIAQYTRIDALIYGTILECETLKTHHKNLLNGDIPELKFKIIGEYLFHNMEEIDKKLMIKKVVRFDDFIKTHSKEIQNNMYKSLISFFNKEDYTNESNSFEKEIKYFSIQKNNIIDKEIVNDKIIIEDHPFINAKVFDFFLIYIKKHILEPYADYSYLFQRIKREKLIVAIKHITFMNWLKDSNYIKEKTFVYFFIQGVFRTETKSSSKDRINNYNNLFEEIFSSKE